MLLCVVRCAQCPLWTTARASALFFKLSTFNLFCLSSRTQVHRFEDHKFSVWLPCRHCIRRARTAARQKRCAWMQEDVHSAEAGIEDTCAWVVEAPPGTFRHKVVQRPHSCDGMPRMVVNVRIVMSYDDCFAALKFRLDGALSILYRFDLVMCT